jgi:hypothetical protein
MSFTKAEIRVRVLQKLGVTEATETPDAADAALVDGVIDAVHAELDADGLVSWPISAVPDKVAESFATMIAYRMAVEGTDFQVPPDTASKLAAAFPVAERRLRRMVSPGFSGEPTEAEYF